jgi:phosphopantothenoylcysteine synthetase/decarboxylase
MRVLVTCGPSYEPIDDVRRLTNFSTGEIGTLLSDAATAAGHEVVCFRGTAATCPTLPATAEVRSFTTNNDLIQQFEDEARNGNIGAIFHASALCDFKVCAVNSVDGLDLRSSKVSSREGRITIELEPAAKVIHRLRDWFPNSKIVGWKYEMSGTLPDVLSSARRQFSEARTDACVVNGRAYGNGFGFYTPDEKLVSIMDKRALSDYLISWISK